MARRSDRLPAVYRPRARSLLAPQPAEAQLTRGALSGTVVDTTGAAVPGASVTARNVATNIARTAVTDANGFYRIPALEPGRYSVAVEMPGFSSVENRDIEVRTTQEVTFDVTVKVSTVTRDGGRHRGIGGGAAEQEQPDHRHDRHRPAGGGPPALRRPRGDNLALLSPNVSYSVNSTDRRAGGDQHLRQRPAVAQQQLHDRRDRQQRHQRHHPDDRGRARGGGGVPGPDQRLQRRVRPQLGGPAQRDHPVGHQRVPRRSLRVLPGEHA